MEARVLVKSLSLIALFCIAFAAPASTFAKGDNSRQYIRFYKINKHEQTDRIRFTNRKGRSAGCHNFLKKTRVHKVIQFGYQACQLYSKKDCADGTEILVTREKDTTPISELTQGFGWLPESEHKRGTKLRSWSCG